jgi:hypothetical protein
VSRVTLLGRAVDAARLRSLATLGAGIALGAGLAVGVASAAPGAQTGLDGAAPAAQPQQRQALLPRRPLHQLLLQRLLERAQRTESLRRLVAGRLVSINAGSAVIQIGPRPDQTRTVRVTPQTRLPLRRPMPGDQVLAVGRTAPDGALVAAAIAVRQPAVVGRRTAAWSGASHATV